MAHYVAPSFRASAYNCPHCGAFAQQRWTQLSVYTGGGYTATILWMDICQHCDRKTYWDRETETMILPRTSTAPMAHEDMPPKAAVLYNEAREVHGVSHRAAAALLRSCVEQLLQDDLKYTGTLNQMIGKAVQDGLPQRYQQMFDVVRITGNELLHPGQIDLEGGDDGKMAENLFHFVNSIVEELITRPAREQAIYDALSERAKAQVAQRDGKTAPELVQPEVVVEPETPTPE